MVKDSGAKVLVTQRALSEALFSGLNLVRVYLDDDKDQIDQQSSEPLPRLAGASNRAYVLYTSGSTGRPKGRGGRTSGIDELFVFDGEGTGA